METMRFDFFFCCCLTQATVKAWMESQPRTTIETERPGYLHAKCLTLIFGFPDSLGVRGRGVVFLLSQKLPILILTPLLVVVLLVYFFRSLLDHGCQSVRSFRVCLCV